MKQQSVEKVQRALGALVFCALFLVFAPSVRAEAYLLDPALPNEGK